MGAGVYSKYNRECWVDGQWMLGCTANTTESVGLMVSGCWGVHNKILLLVPIRNVIPTPLQNMWKCVRVCVYVCMHALSAINPKN